MWVHLDLFIHAELSAEVHWPCVYHYYVCARAHAKITSQSKSWSTESQLFSINQSKRASSQTGVTWRVPQRLNTPVGHHRSSDESNTRSCRTIYRPYALIIKPICTWLETFPIMQNACFRGLRLGTVNFINVLLQLTAEGRVNMHKSSIFVADELQREPYYMGNFQGTDYHLGNFKYLKMVHGFCCKMPMEKVRICHKQCGSWVKAS